MRVPTDVLKSVCFVCARNPDTQAYRCRGTAFFVTWSEGDGWPQTYLVTARHCVTMAQREGDGAVYLCLNTKDGGTRHVCIAEDWVYPHDGTVDLAMVPFEIADNDDIKVINTRYLLTPASIDKHAIDIGDDLWIIGLFSPVPGRTRNQPIVRVGTIAAVPGEPITGTLAPDGNEIAPHISYLVEVRSVGGLSGSPVWVHLPYGRGYDADNPPPRLSREEKRRREYGGILGGSPSEHSPNYLLGIIRMHWRTDTPAEGHYLIDRGEPHVVNMGIAGVTPIQALRELLLRDDMRAMRKARVEDFMRHRGDAR